MTLKCKKAFLNGKRGFLKPLFVFLAAFQPLLVLAEESKAEMSQIGASLSQPSDYFVQIMLSLILVLLIIFISAWLLRRYGRFPGVADGNLNGIGCLVGWTAGTNLVASSG